MGGPLSWQSVGGQLLALAEYLSRGRIQFPAGRRSGGRSPGDAEALAPLGPKFDVDFIDASRRPLLDSAAAARGTGGAEDVCVCELAVFYAQ